jgi:hypothetical protein
VSCEFASVATQQENKPCSEYKDEEICLDGEIDWQILDASLRPDCAARYVRDIFVRFEGSPERERLLPDCSHNTLTTEMDDDELKAIVEKAN